MAWPRSRSAPHLPHRARTVTAQVQRLKALTNGNATELRRLAPGAALMGTRVELPRFGKGAGPQGKKQALPQGLQKRLALMRTP